MTTVMMRNLPNKLGDTVAAKEVLDGNWGKKKDSTREEDTTGWYMQLSVHTFMHPCIDSTDKQTHTNLHCGHPSIRAFLHTA